MANVGVLALFITVLNLPCQGIAQSTDELLDQALVLIDKGEIQKAKALASRAFASVDGTTSRHYGKAAYMYGKALSAGGNFENASTYYEKAMEYADVKADTSLLAEILLAYGLIRIQREKYADGERNLQSAIELGQASDDLKTVAMGFSYLALSQALQGNISQSIAMDRSAGKMAERISNSKLAVATFANIGQSFAEIKEYDSASHYTRKAIELAIADSNTYYLRICYDNLAYFQINSGRLDSTIQSQIDHFHTLRLHGFDLDTSGFESKMYIQRQMLLMADSIDSAYIQSELQNVALTEEANQKEESVWTWRIVSILLSVVIITLLFEFYRKHSAHKHLQAMLNIKILELEKLRESIPATQEAKLLESIDGLNSIMQNLRVAANEGESLWISCFLLRSFGLSYNEIGKHLNKSKSVIYRNFKDMSEALDISTEKLLAEAEELGEIIWRIDAEERNKNEHSDREE